VTTAIISSPWKQVKYHNYKGVHTVCIINVDI